MIKFTQAAFLVSIFCAYVSAQNKGFDHALIDKLLKENVNEQGLVDYAGFRGNPGFDEYLNAIAEANIENLPQSEKLAFLVNAYNAIVIKNVLDHYPINSPMDVKGFFKEKKFKVAGKEITPDELEYDYILKMEPVLSHFGLVCAAVSCPKLLNKAYIGETVLSQLEENAKIFLNDQTKNRLDRGSKILYLSEIFKWFRKNFEEKYGSLVESAKHFLNDEDKKFLEENAVEIKFIPYNWQLNSQ